MISVIVPVYNVERYIDQCVHSILTQTYSDFELILVDDGSTDNSGKICDNYLKIDSRVKVIHKTNGGLSDARNVGTTISIGSHVTYIDSDDFVSVDYLEQLNYLLVKYGADIAVTGIESFVDNEMDVKNGKTKHSINEFCFSGFEALENVLYQKNMDTSACSILLPKNIAIENLFPLGKYHEDDFTTYKYYLKARSVAVTTRKQYFYRQRTGSIMHTFGKAQIDELDAADNLVMECAKIGLQLKKAAESKRFSNYCQVLSCFHSAHCDNRFQYDRIAKVLKRSRYSILFNRHCRFKNRFAAAICCFGVRTFAVLNSLIR